MKRTVFILMLALCCNAINGQVPGIYNSLPEALRNPDAVLELHLKGRRIKDFPSEILTFPNLEVLDLSRNRISFIPQEISRLHRLRKLVLNRNRLTGLPAGIGELAAIDSLDLWDNYISSFPESASGMRSLKWVDLRGNAMNREEQEAISALLPGVDIRFSQYCNCRPHVREKAPQQ